MPLAGRPTAAAPAPANLSSSRLLNLASMWTRRARPSDLGSICKGSPWRKLDQGPIPKLEFGTYNGVHCGCMWRREVHPSDTPDRWRARVLLTAKYQNFFVEISRSISLLDPGVRLSEA